MDEKQSKQTVYISSSYVPQRNTGFYPTPYRLDELRGGNLPRRKYYETHQEMIEAVEAANPDREVQVG